MQRINESTYYVPIRDELLKYQGYFPVSIFFNYMDKSEICLPIETTLDGTNYDPNIRESRKRLNQNNNQNSYSKYKFVVVSIDVDEDLSNSITLRILVISTTFRRLSTTRASLVVADDIVVDSRYWRHHQPLRELSGQSWTKFRNAVENLVTTEQFVRRFQKVIE
ncbi:Uncharacterized protein Fot_16651 [Forsythia ovata]|uniref:Uncharacterized protein n=1 Tax=Forsythia ovata TaxID=205694 RepID=A0ABD1VD29_9LAMI